MNKMELSEIEDFSGKTFYFSTKPQSFFLFILFPLANLEYAYAAIFSFLIFSNAAIY